MGVMLPSKLINAFVTLSRYILGRRDSSTTKIIPISRGMALTAPMQKEGLVSELKRLMGNIRSRFSRIYKRWERIKRPKNASSQIKWLKGKPDTSSCTPTPTLNSRTMPSLPKVSEVPESIKKSKLKISKIEYPPEKGGVFIEETEETRANPSLESIKEALSRDAKNWIILNEISRLPLNKDAEGLNTKINGKKSDVVLKDVLSSLSKKLRISFSEFVELCKEKKNSLFLSDILKSRTSDEILNSLSDYLICLVAGNTFFTFSTYTNAFEYTNRYLRHPSSDHCKMSADNSIDAKVISDSEDVVYQVTLSRYARMVFLTFLNSFCFYNY